MIRLLVVDDSPLMRRLLTGLFEAEGDFLLAQARDGVEALARLHDFAPDVVTLDVQMPRLGGLACLERIMLERPCPVVMLSALTASGAEATLEALRQGAVDVVPKPGGAVSLSMETLGPELVRKVRAAARARPRGAHRLAERVRLRAQAALRGAAPPGIPPATPRDAPRGEPALSCSAAPPPRPVFPAMLPQAPGLPGGVVLVGASTGGPPALEALLAPLPAGFPWPLVVAQHMPAAFTGPLARRLDGQCALSVEEVARPVPLRPGHAYVARGDADILLSRRPEGLVALPVPALAAYRWHPSVDRLVESAMQHLPASRLAGVLLTGMGNDGAAAMARLHAGGGRTLAEAEESAVIWGMPGSLVRCGGASQVAPVEAMAALLRQWVEA
ncbi:chemotaxis response regulator protein-glutamate methylesterase [Pseudoroseomonas rhizosphaerae]|uniref:Protein-glutamate methylesterase/protein-glutamine glutaminase n=1 Tax=Teichococcus rhizosphaerae TaxID=1335062 RepID=A0A2C7A4L7_9PROT|nr:chemotaxis-specific protein-glutamate methyltransferase CheB [Pseudoroseomonas rhizosphaerae]PHK93290.1 chemotaxis response regulator protein-glutamate methylesterase [Pseudoroseomonas rhizosphaerae]